MKHLVIGFKTFDKSEEGFPLYAGNDAKLAKELVRKEEPGVVRKALYMHPQPSKRCEFPGQEGFDVESAEPAASGDQMDFPTLKAVLVMLKEALEEANKRLADAGKPAVIVFLAEHLTELDEDEVKELDALKALEDASLILVKRAEDLDVLRDELAAANGELIARQEELAKLREELEEARKAGPPAAGDSDGGTPPLQLEGAPKEEGKPPAKAPKNK